MIGDFNIEANFPYKLLLTNTQVSKICKAFADGLLANINFSKTRLSKMIELAGVLIPLFGPLGLILPVKMINQMADVYKKELKTKDIIKEIETKDVDDPPVDTGLNVLGRKIGTLCKKVKK